MSLPSSIKLTWLRSVTHIPPALVQCHALFENYFPIIRIRCQPTIFLVGSNHHVALLGRDFSGHFPPKPTTFLQCRVIPVCPHQRIICTPPPLCPAKVSCFTVYSALISQIANYKANFTVWSGTCRYRCMYIGVGNFA